MNCITLFSSYARSVAALWIVATVLSGCGGAMAPMTPAEGGAGSDDRAKVEALIAKIEGDVAGYREEFGIEAGESGGDPGVTGEASPDCGRVCRISEAICVSAEKVCVIANQNLSNALFQERCTWATGECGKSRERCEACQ